MKKIIIYKEPEGNTVVRAHWAPEDKTEDDIEKAINKYNSTQTNRVVSCITVPDELCDVIEYLINDRQLDVSRHLEAIRDMQNDIDNMSRDLDSVMSDLRMTLKTKKK